MCAHEASASHCKDVSKSNDEADENDPIYDGGAHRCKRSQAVAGGRKHLRCPFLAKNLLLRAPCNCTMACDPSTPLPCALCHENSFHHIFILTKKNGFAPESNNCIGRWRHEYEEKATMGSRGPNFAAMANRFLFPLLMSVIMHVRPKKYFVTFM